MKSIKIYYWLLLTFSLPGCYLIYSRLLRNSERISWCLVFPLAVLFTSILVVPHDWKTVLQVFSLSFIAWLCIYELGYLENDAFTIGQESNPTLRINPEEIGFVKTGFYKITSIRFLVFLSITYLLWRFYGDHFSLDYYFAMIGATRLVFYFHNQVRSRWNILSYFALALGKYLFLALILFRLEFPLLLLILILAFPVPRTLEHACKVKYGLKWIKRLVREFDLFRVRYYGIMVLICGLLFLQSPEGEMGLALSVFGYFFLFRVLIWSILQFSTYRRSEFNVHQWDKN